jgi:hypothetical protein
MSRTLSIILSETLDFILKNDYTVHSHHKIELKGNPASQQRRQDPPMSSSSDVNVTSDTMTGDGSELGMVEKPMY